MKATLTNLGSSSIPLTSAQGDGLAVTLLPGVAYVLDREEITVVTVGDNPDFEEDLKLALTKIKEEVMRLLQFWRDMQPKDATAPPVVTVRIIAHEDNAIRVTGDDKNSDAEVSPGATYDASGYDYIELRQLGIDNSAKQPEAP